MKFFWVQLSQNVVEARFKINRLAWRATLSNLITRTSGQATL